jgi:hypothetical protein
MSSRCSRALLDRLTTMVSRTSNQTPDIHLVGRRPRVAEIVEGIRHKVQWRRVVGRVAVGLQNAGRNYRQPLDNILLIFICTVESGAVLGLLLGRVLSGLMT